MDTYLFAWLLCGIAALQLFALLYRIATSPLRKVPGPLLARFTDAWYFWRLYRGHFNTDNRNLHAKYGNPFLLSSANAPHDSLPAGTPAPNPCPQPLTDCPSQSSRLTQPARSRRPLRPQPLFLQ